MIDQTPTTRPVGWGILGASRVAEQTILPSVMAHPWIEMRAVAARHPGRAARLASNHGIPNYYGGYEPLLYDPDIEVIYVALANADHALWTLRALEAGKHVLVEKPFAMNTFEANAMVGKARENYLLVMEAWSYRFHPLFEEILWLVQDGAIGELRLVRAAFSQTPASMQDFRWSRPLGGGALFDLGGFGVSAARAFVGHEPFMAVGQADLGRTGVDDHFYAILDFGGGVRALIDCSLRGPARQQLELVGSRGVINLTNPWNPGRGDVQYVLNGEACTVRGANQHTLMLEHFAQAIRNQQPLCVPLEDGIRQARVMDALLRSSRTGRSIKVD
jgi:predicted dehydrogenase